MLWREPVRADHNRQSVRAKPVRSSGVIVMRTFPKYKVAAAHVAPVFANNQETVAKACDYIAQAAAQGVRLIAFSESFLPGFPFWGRVVAPIDSHALFTLMVQH